MIFVTVGTHEQPFDRLVKEIDRLKEEDIITEKLFIQTGYSIYRPRFCEYAEFIKFDEMMKKIQEARIIITHGGPGSIMPVLYNGKIPIVVPRQKRYGEHIDDHQIHFCKKLEEESKIISIYEIEDLEYILKQYDKLTERFKKNKMNSKEKIHKFAKILDKLCKEL